MLKGKIIIYGLGKQFQANKEKFIWENVVALCDKNATVFHAEDFPCPVIKPTQLMDYKFDYIVVTPAYGIAREILNELASCYGIKDTQIISLGKYLEKQDFRVESLYSVCDMHEIDSFLDVSNYMHEFGILTDTNQRVTRIANVKWSGNKRKEALLMKPVVSRDEFHKSVKDIDALSVQYRFIIFPCLADLEKDAKGLMLLNYKVHYEVALDFSGIIILENTADVEIYVVTHKDYIKPEEDIYKTLWVGMEIDDGGIYYLNSKINECTGLYWIWKNSSARIVGLNHYRRYFYNVKTQNIVSKEEVYSLLKDYDICVVSVCNDNKSNYEFLKEPIDNTAAEIACDILKDMIAKYQPAYVETFEKVMHEYKSFFPCNMFITYKEIMDKYCEWLFSFLIPAAEKFNDTPYDAYSRRAIGFFAERMLTVWLLKQNYRIKELPILLKND